MNHSSRWAKVFLLSASTLLFPMESFARSDNAYGAKAPFNINDLPPGLLKQQLMDLPPAAQKRAVEWLHRFDFHEHDIPDLRVDRDGGVFYEDPAFDGVDPAPESSPELSEITQAEAFTLHSKPGASRVVYLDMDGHVVSGTIWNSTADPLYMRPYDSNGDESTFTQTELSEIAETWKRVAEDFAPYDIDVTTEEPPAFGPNVGHILVTRKADENNRNIIYNCSCGGVAYVGVWGRSNYTYYQPALVFLDGVGGPHNISEAASHELGHNLNLSHDGTSTVGYYSGHGSGNTDWGPIMGVGYYAQISQWSKGEYADANNTQDDLQIIANYLSYRADDHEDVNFVNASPLVINGGTVVSSTNPVSDPANTNPSNKGIIEDRNDVDLFFMDVGDGTIDLDITPAWVANYASQSRRGMNLDVRAVLYDEFGFEVAQSDVAGDTYATINTSVTAGRYILSVEGVGAGDPLTNGYTDYGSLGQYFISGTVPEDLVSTSPPIAPNDLMAVQTGDADIALSWTDPASVVENNESGYRVYRQVDGGSFVMIATLPRDSTGYADNNLPSGEYVYQVEAFNSAGSNTSNLTTPMMISVPTVTHAASETSIAGSVVVGSYLNTASAEDYERITEQHQGGKPQNRVSRMEHHWTISGIPAAATVTLDVDASAPSNGEGDDFAFAYSTDGSNYVPFATLLNGTGRQVMSAVLPYGTNGTVYLQVVDTDRTKGNGQTSSVDIYQIQVMSSGAAGDMPPSVSITEPVSNEVVEEGELVVFSASANDDEDGDVSGNIGWSSSRDGNLGQGATLQTSTLSLGVHQVTALVTDSAGNSGSANVTVTVEPIGGSALAVDSVSPGSIPAGGTTPVTVSGSGFVEGVSLTFLNGSGGSPTASNVTVVDGNTITADVYVKNGGPRRNRTWDVVVTNPGSSSATCTGCLIVTP